MENRYGRGGVCFAKGLFICREGEEESGLFGRGKIVGVFYVYKNG